MPCRSRWTAATCSSIALQNFLLSVEIKSAFPQRHDLCGTLPLHLLSAHGLRQFVQQTQGIGRRPALGRSALVQLDQQALNGRLVELQHQPVERGDHALVRQPTTCFVNPPTRHRRQPNSLDSAPRRRDAIGMGDEQFEQFPLPRVDRGLRLERGVSPHPCRRARRPRSEDRPAAAALWPARRRAVSRPPHLALFDPKAGRQALQNLFFAEAGIPRRVVPQPRRLRHDGDQLLQCRAGPVYVPLQIDAPGLRLEGVIQRIDSLGGQQFRKRGRPIFVQIIARVEPFGQRENSQVGLLGHEQFQHLVRPLRARLVAVEHQHDPIGVGFQDADVRLAQGSAQHGHRVLEPELVGHDHVGVALHHQHRRRFRFSQRLAGQIEPIKELALGEQRRLGRIDVFCWTRGPQLRQHPPANAHRPALGVVDRKQEPALEPIVIAAAVGRPGQNADRFEGLSPDGGLPAVRRLLPLAAKSSLAPAAKSRVETARCFRW